MFYPAHINLQTKKCLVVGGGTVAERKVVAMLLSGGDVTLVSPDATELLRFLAKTDRIRWHKRQLNASDTTGYFLVCAATDFIEINTAVFHEAYEKNGIRLVNVVDVIPQCTFAAASVVTDGEIMLSISTSGKSPATSRRIREYFERTLHTTSLYTLGYENGKPVPIENQGIPYPVYLLMENRKCVVLCEQRTPEIERRISLLKQCGADLVCELPKATEATSPENPHHLEDVFLVITDDSVSVSDIPCEDNGTRLSEYLDAPEKGTHITPELVIDADLIISVSARKGIEMDKVKSLHQKLTPQFANGGYGAFIEFLGTRRAEILRALPTPKKRADFFETLIDTIESGNARSQACCLGLTNPECAAECLFNWVRCGALERANSFTTELLDAYNG